MKNAAFSESRRPGRGGHAGGFGEACLGCWATACPPGQVCRGPACRRRHVSLWEDRARGRRRLRQTLIPTPLSSEAGLPGRRCFSGASVHAGSRSAVGSRLGSRTGSLWGCEPGPSSRRLRLPRRVNVCTDGEVQPARLRTLPRARGGPCGKTREPSCEAAGTGLGADGTSLLEARRARPGSQCGAQGAGAREAAGPAER